MIEWKEYTLGNISSMRYGKMPNKELISDSGCPIFTGYQIVGFYPEYNCEEKQIIIVARGVGGTGDVKLSPPKCYVTNLSIIVELDTDIVDKKYFYYKYQKRNLKYLDSGSAQSQITIDSLRSLSVYLPELSKQKKIVGILSALDNKIHLLRRQNETLEAIAQTLFKRWFVEFEFPNKEGQPYKSSGGKMVSSELGEIPDGWGEKCFYELGAYINGGAFKQEDFSQHNAGLPIIKIVELKCGITDQTKYTEKQPTDKIIINDKDILFSWSGSPETSIDIFVWNLGRGVLNQHIFKVIPNKSIERTWLYNLLKFYKPLFIRIAKQKQTTGLGHVTVADLRENKVIFPNNKILAKYNLIADPIFKKYYLNLKEISTVSKLRDILLPKLMSGQIRVK